MNGKKIKFYSSSSLVLFGYSPQLELSRVLDDPSLPDTGGSDK